MTGPEHYREAERLITEGVDAFDSTDPEQQPLIAQILATAQVHATLAQAAALNIKEFEAWRKVAGTS